MEKLKVGFIVTGSSHFDPKYAQASREKALELLGKMEIALFTSAGIATSVDELAPVVGNLKKEDIDLLIVQAGSFSWDNLAAHIVSQLPNIPMILWAVREPPMDGGMLKVNSLCSVMMNGAALGKLGKEFRFAYGAPGDARVSEVLTQSVRVVSALKKLRTSKLGLAGYRPPGFYGSTFNEMALRKLLGIEMEHIGLTDIMDAYSGMSDEAVAKDAEVWKSGGYGRSDAVDEGLLNSSRLYLAIKKCIDDNSVAALALKCWPELANKDLLPCVANSRLNDDGIPVACEGDVHGAMSQMMQTALTGEPTFFCDLVDLDESRNAAFFWHCGACPAHYAGGKEKSSLGTQPSRVATWNYTCPIIEFPVKPGRVTVCRLCELNGKYRLFVATGEALEIGLDMRGNCTWVKLDSDARRTVEFIVENHVEHHFALSYGDLRDDLALMAQMTGMEMLVSE